MTRREELEKEINAVQAKIENVDKSTPEMLLELWKKELDSLSFELDNLYDDTEYEM